MFLIKKNSIYEKPKAVSSERVKNVQVSDHLVNILLSLKCLQLTPTRTNFPVSNYE